MEILEDQLERVAFGSLPAGLGALELECGQLRLLLEVSESIASHRDIAALFQDLAQRLPRIVPFDLINLVLYDPTRDLMRVHALVVPHVAIPLDQAMQAFFRCVRAGEEPEYPPQTAMPA